MDTFFTIVPTVSRLSEVKPGTCLVILNLGFFSLKFHFRERSLGHSCLNLMHDSNEPLEARIGAALVEKSVREKNVYSGTA